MNEAGVIVEFFGIPRLRAGVAELTVPPGSVAEVLAQVRQRCPGLAEVVTPEGRLAPHYLLSIGGIEFVTDLSRCLPWGARLLLLSADAGG